MASQKRKKTMKKIVKKNPGLLGRAGRGLLGRGASIRQAVEGTPTRKKKTTAKKKRKRY